MFHSKSILINKTNCQVAQKQNATFSICLDSLKMNIDQEMKNI